MSNDIARTKTSCNVLISTAVLPTAEEAAAWPEANVGVIFVPALREKGAADVLGMIPEDISHPDKQTNWDAGVELKAFNLGYVVDAFEGGYVHIFNGDILYTTFAQATATDEVETELPSEEAEKEPVAVAVSEPEPGTTT